MGLKGYQPSWYGENQVPESNIVSQLVSTEIKEDLNAAEYGMANFDSLTWNVFDFELNIAFLDKGDMIGK